MRSLMPPLLPRRTPTPRGFRCAGGFPHAAGSRRDWSAGHCRSSQSLTMRLPGSTGIGPGAIGGICMRLTHLAVGVAAALALGAAPASASAAMPAGASASTIYVDNGDSACTDTGTGTAAAPFCTIQAAADAAEPGQTVLVDPGANALNPATWQSYDEDVQITRSGAPGDPITFAVGGAPWFGSDWGDPSWPSVTLSGEGTPVDTGFSLSGAHDI